MYRQNYSKTEKTTTGHIRQQTMLKQDRKDYSKTEKNTGRQTILQQD